MSIWNLPHLLKLRIRLRCHVWGHAPQVHCKAPDPGKHQIQKPISNQIWQICMYNLYVYIYIYCRYIYVRDSSIGLSQSPISYMKGSIIPIIIDSGFEHCSSDSYTEMNRGKSLSVSLLDLDYHPKKDRVVQPNLQISTIIKQRQGSESCQCEHDPTSSDLNNQKTVGLPIEKVRPKEQEQLECNKMYCKKQS